MKAHSNLLRSLLAGLTALGLAGCYIPSQRYPGPMRAEQDPLPPGARDLYPEGPEEVLIVRISDPVFVKRPGEASSYPLYFYRKQARMNAGSWVSTASGGRIEIIYPDKSVVTLYGLASGVVGSASRQDPIFEFFQVEKAQVNFRTTQQVRLLGGALLETDTGPFIIERPEERILRVRNRSKGEGRVAYRDRVFPLDPGEVLDMPLLDEGTGPVEEAAGFQRLAGADARIEVRGEVERVEGEAGGVRLRANGEHEVRAYGVRVRLDDGQEVVLGDLDDASPTTNNLIEPAEDSQEDSEEGAGDEPGDDSEEAGGS